MTWFQSLNPLLVIVMTPFCSPVGGGRRSAGREHSPLQKMAIGALIVAGAYVLLAPRPALGRRRQRKLALARSAISSS